MRIFSPTILFLKIRFEQAVSLALFGK